MKRLAGITFFALMALMISSCGEDAQSEAEIVADKICQCSEPALEIQEKMEAAKEDPQRIQAIMDEYQDEMNQMIDCQNEIEEQYGEKLQDRAFEDEVMNAVREACPKIAEQMDANI